MKYRLIDAINRIDDDLLLCYDPCPEHFEIKPRKTELHRIIDYRAIILTAAAAIIILFVGIHIMTDKYVVRDGSVSETKDISKSDVTDHTEATSKAKIDTDCFTMDIKINIAVESFKNCHGCVLIAEYAGSYNLHNNKTIEYNLKRISYVHNPEDYNIGSTFDLYVSTGLEPVFSDMKDGDRVMIMVKKLDSSYDTDEYMLNAINIFYINEGILYSALEIDSEYDGLSVEEFKMLLND
ncbi:MAG: hypothetical protein K6F92_03865 [Lachnospiraceae bacterium]|nr:hypothetical protein [Lachnospiraceae bacterium]